MKIVAITAAAWYQVGNITSPMHLDLATPGLIAKFEEVCISGPNGPMPVIRVHEADGSGYTDFIKHNLISIKYET